MSGQTPPSWGYYRNGNGLTMCFSNSNAPAPYNVNVVGGRSRIISNSRGGGHSGTTTRSPRTGTGRLHFTNDMTIEQRVEAAFQQRGSKSFRPLSTRRSTNPRPPEDPANIDFDLVDAAEDGRDEMMILNFENIRQMDPHIKRIVDSASQVAIFNYADSGWEKALAVGSLLIYERYGDGKLGVVVLNRVSPTNWIHFATEQFELVIERPFLLLKDTVGIFCIWFYDDDDCQRLADTFKRLGYRVLVKTESPNQRIRMLHGPGENEEQANTWTQNGQTFSCYRKETKKYTMTGPSFSSVTFGQPDTTSTPGSSATVTSTSGVACSSGADIPTSASGNDILQMLRSSGQTDPPKEVPKRNAGSSLLALMSLPNNKPPDNRKEEVFAHPFPAKVKPKGSNKCAASLDGKSSDMANDSGPMAQLCQSQSSSFATVTNMTSDSQKPQSSKSLKYIMKKLAVLDSKKQDTEAGSSGGQVSTEVQGTNISKTNNSGFTTVEQLEHDWQLGRPSGSNSSDVDVNHSLSQEITSNNSSQGLIDTNPDLSNDLRIKLGLLPSQSTTSVSPSESNDCSRMNIRADVTSETDEDNNVGPSFSNVPSRTSSAFDNEDDCNVWTPPISPTQAAPDSAFKNENKGYNFAGGNNFPTIDDIHGRRLDEVEPEELALVFRHHPGNVSDLVLLPTKVPGTNTTELIWTNVTRQDVVAQQQRLTSLETFAPGASASEAAGFSAETLNEIAQYGVKDLPLTVDQFVKTFKVLLRDEEFVRKFHNAYLQVRSEEEF